MPKLDDGAMRLLRLAAKEADDAAIKEMHRQRKIAREAVAV